MNLWDIRWDWWKGLDLRAVVGNILFVFVALHRLTLDSYGKGLGRVTKLIIYYLGGKSGYFIVVWQIHIVGFIR